MIGYWSPSCPVKTGHPDILATVYARDNKSLVSLAGWADRDVAVGLRIDWKTLGLNPGEVSIFAPFIAEFQEETRYAVGDRILIPAGQGKLIFLSQDGN